MPFRKLNETNLSEIERRLKANDTEYNTQFKYADNYICTSKYNVFTFFPKNLFEQFQRLANAYFLGLLVLQFIPQVTSLTPYTTIVPLVFVLAITAIKDAIDDFNRHRSDATVNNRVSIVLRDGQLVEERWQKVVVGDIIKMQNNQFVAADLLLLSTSEPNSLCYIETAELDGETNLKVKQPLPETAMLDEDISKFNEFDAEIVCEPPNNRLPKFEGKMNWKEESYSLDNDNILLRGCVLRNTKWCYGLVIFSGHETKLMMNSGQTVFKRTNIDRLMNTLILGIFAFLAYMCVVCTICCGIFEANILNKFQIYLPWESYIPGTRRLSKDGTVGKAGTVGEGATVIGLLVFFSYIIVLNTVVPISLYVSVEIIRLGNSLLINWDNKMYYEPKDDPAKARSTALNEELGQIEYIFSDKTGTLTQNIMEFKKSSINGQSYGDVVDAAGDIVDTSQVTPKCDFSWNPYAEEAFEFYDQRVITEVQQNNKQFDNFFRLLALCHTVMPENNEGRLLYQAQSPDEGALVSAARNFGYVFKSRTPKTITIEVKGEEVTYDVLAILDFNNVRKRMSVIVRRDGNIQLWCKGADSVIYERLDSSCSELQETTTHHLHAFAQEGLRTLCLAFKDISDDEYNTWAAKHKEASLALENRDDKLDAVYEEIEQNLVLIGATAIEDKLQDGVPEAIANLARADIKIWVLTGDKQVELQIVEWMVHVTVRFDVPLTSFTPTDLVLATDLSIAETAINIGYSCQLLTEEMEEVFVIDEDDMDTVMDQMDKALQRISDYKESNGTPAFNSEIEVGYDPTRRISDSTSIKGQLDFALVISGHSLAHCLKPDLEMKLLELGCMCKAVICCRVTPLQKALVVELVKNNKPSLTLAIGDGANDVSMIKTAHIGVGISGQEGMQAVLSSDYSFSQFRYLERLLLVHGRWSYLRMCKFLKYFFYKNFAFTLCNFWYAIFCGFSAMTLFDPFFISFYNVFYTGLPVLALGLFDQGAVSSLVLFFIPYGAFYELVSPDGIDNGGRQFFGVAIASILVVAVNIRCALDTHYWTLINHVVIWGSIVFYFCFMLALYAPVFNYTYQGSAYVVFASWSFWFTLLLTTVILIVPVVAYRFYKVSITPTMSDKIRLQQRAEKSSKSRPRSREIPVRKRISSHHKEFERSGYAFAHQSGFGALITSGRNFLSAIK